MNKKIKDTASDISAEAHRLSQRLAEGTEGMSDFARARVIAAREKALEARQQVRRAASSGSDAAVDLFDRQPLVMGALAFAVGAAIGAVLPKTRAEDTYLTPQRSALKAEAERIFAEEKARAEAMIADKS